MTLEGLHASEAWSDDVRTTRRRARAVTAALGATVLMRAAMIPTTAWQAQVVSDLQRGLTPSEGTIATFESLRASLGLAQAGLFVVTGVLFLRWVHRLTAAARGLGVDAIPWTPGDVVVAFVVPVLNLVRPYGVMRDLYEQLAPEHVPAPAPRVEPLETSGYRSVALSEPPPPVAPTRASIGAWWITFWVGNLLENAAARQGAGTLDAIERGLALGAASDCVEVVSAVLAILVVRALTARLTERARRVGHLPADALAAARIVVTPREA